MAMAMAIWLWAIANSTIVLDCFGRWLRIGDTSYTFSFIYEAIRETSAVHVTHIIYSYMNILCMPHAQNVTRLYLSESFLVNKASVVNV